MEFIDIGDTAVILMHISYLQMDYSAFFLFCCFHIYFFLQRYGKYGK